MRHAFIAAWMIFTSLTAQAWTPKTYQVIVVKSVQLMPASFRHIMLNNKEQILSGCLNPDEAGEQEHRYDAGTKKGFLQDRILELTESIPRKIHDHVPFREVAVDFGRLAHYLADLNDPLILGDADSRESEYRADFARYLERNIDKFPWIFDGHENPILARSDLKDYFYSIAFNTVEKYPRLGEAYFPNGALVSSDTFDPKSHPFGIASLSYSHSIGNTVQIWFYVWRKSHGDIGHTPFYRKTLTNRSPR